MDIPGYVAFPQKPEVLKTKPEKKKERKKTAIWKCLLFQRLNGEKKVSKIKLCTTRTSIDAGTNRKHRKLI